MTDGAHRRHGLLLAGAALCAAAVVAAAPLAPKQAAAGWLIGVVFWSEVTIGSLLLTMIHRLTGGRWGVALRPAIAPLAATIPLFFLLIVPVFIAAPLLYPWAAGSAAIKPDVLTAYLNLPWFIGRSLIALAGWSALALLLPRLDGPRGLLLAAVGLAFHCVVIGPIGFDWILSIAPPFASSSFGASLAITQLIAAMAFALVGLPLSEEAHSTEHGASAPSPPSGGEGRGEGVYPRVASSAFVEAPLTPTLSPQERGEGARALPLVAGDLGGLLLAFTLGITYVDFMAVLVIWYGDLPRSTAWFVTRNHLPWTALAWAAFGLVSLLPFGALILSRVRTSRTALRVVAAGVLIGLFCYDAWLVAPPFGAAALLPALLATIAIGLMLTAATTWPLRFTATGRRPAYGD